MTAPKQDVHESVTSYLSSLVWDGTPRLDRWLVDYAEADDTPLIRRAGRKILIATVSRARLVKA
jgi:predicted P-loop ATPase